MNEEHGLNIPGYRIEDEIGRGGMATVYLAVQESLQRQVALKVMKAALAADEEFAERFVREARTAASLQHPGIVSIFDTGNVGHHYYISMEYVTGGELKALLHDGALRRNQAIRITREIADALAYAQEKGFVHRDVKPENILFREKGNAVLTDFGVARAVGTGTRLTGTGLSIGTPHYMSPEQARGDEVDGRSDLYAIGIVLFEMLTGRVPFEARDSLAIGIKHLQDPIPQLPGNLQQVQPIIDRLLAKDPDDRYQTGAELIEELDRIDQGERLKPQHAGTRVVKRVDRGLRAVDQESRTTEHGKGTGHDSRSGLYWGLAGAALAVLLGIGIYPGQDQPGNTPGSASPERASWQPGDVFRECPDCPELVMVPAGRFNMGSPMNEPQRGSSEGPQRQVKVSAFALGKYAVMFDEWDACVADGGCNYRPGDQGWGRGTRPVINVNWNDAQEYVRWLSSKTGGEYRLASEAEWEYAARAGTTTRFNTGDCITTVQAHFNGRYPAQGCPRGQYRQRTVPVGSFDPNAFGLYDMHGNVWEWVQDCWNDSYRGAPTDGSVWVRGDCSRAVARGGSWHTSGNWLRSATREGHARVSRSGVIGFRVARSVAQ